MRLNLGVNTGQYSVLEILNLSINKCVGTLTLPLTDHKKARARFARAFGKIY